jgi:soluble lytic murein transglycosylase-like protein
MFRFHYEKEIAAAAAAHGLDKELVKAVVLVESSGNTASYRYEPGFWLRYMAEKPEYRGAVPERVSASYGLMQCMYTTAQQHGYILDPEHLMVPDVGLRYGCLHLSYLVTECQGDVEMALAQYNGGKGGNEQRPFRNQLYVHKVMKLYKGLKGEA